MTDRKYVMEKGSGPGEWLIGLTDGLIVPFALTAGLSRISAQEALINTGLVVTGVCAIIMGFGAYLTSRKENLESQAGEELTLSTDINAETENTKALLANLGLSEQLQNEMVADQLREKKEFESILDTNTNGFRSAPASGFNVGLAYAAGGLITLIPYFFQDQTSAALPYSAAITLICLVIVGYLKGKLSGINPVASATRWFITGLAAGLGAYFVGGFFLQ